MSEDGNKNNKNKNNKSSTNDDDNDDDGGKNATTSNTSTSTSITSTTSTTSTTTIDLSAIVPQLNGIGEDGVTFGELQIAVKVLNAVAALKPNKKKQQQNNQKQKQKQKQKKQNNYNENDNDNDNKTKKRKQEEGEDGESRNTDTKNNDKKEDNDDNDNDDKNNHDDDWLQKYQHSNLRPLRKAISSCITIQQQTMYSGKSQNEFLKEKWNVRNLKRQKMAERDTQRKFIATTELRRGRIEKLRSKQNDGQNEELIKLQYRMMMIPDGHVETTSATTPLLLPSSSSSATNDGTENKMLIENQKEKETNGNDKEQQKIQEQSSAGVGEDKRSTTVQLPRLRSCYVCKTKFRQLHHFYDQLCPPCATLNWQKRHQTADLRGKVAIVTGSRVKIGYQTCLKLLRAGAYVVATTRFPNAAVANYRKENDFHLWSDRLQVYGLDFRDVTGLEAFCRFVKQQFISCGIDILINNACQTIRRPTGYYLPACQQEQELWNNADEVHKKLLTGCLQFERVRRKLLIDHQSTQQQGGGPVDVGTRQLQIQQDPTLSTTSSLLGIGVSGTPTATASAVATASTESEGMTTSSMDVTDTKNGTTIEMETVNDDGDNDNGKDIDNNNKKGKHDVGSSLVKSISKTSSTSSTATMTTTTTTTTSPFEVTGMSHSTAMSQMILLPEDGGVNNEILPPGITDINGQQLDLRTTNSWLLKMEQISTPEIMECMFINTIAPFVLNSRLKPLMSNIYPATANKVSKSNSTSTTTDDNNSNNTNEQIPERVDRYIINVSAMEGKFYRYKMANHPHTNMAKAALNMMTRTSAEDLAKQHRIYMNSVDTGWINDENPLEKASTIAKTNLFQTPIDEIDAAARILDPIFTGINQDMEYQKEMEQYNDEQKKKKNTNKLQEPKRKPKDYGKFLKDYRETEW